MFFLISQDFSFTLKFKLLFNRQLNIQYLGDIIQQWLVAVKIALQLTLPRNAMLASDSQASYLDFLSPGSAGLNIRLAK